MRRSVPVGSLALAAVLVVAASSCRSSEDTFTYTQRSGSMVPTVRVGEQVTLSRVVGDLRRGDIVVFRPPNSVRGRDDDQLFLKRVVGLPGEVVELVEGRVVVDGEAIAETYLPRGTTTVGDGREGKWTVPKGQVFLLGDNRAASNDSRNFGPVAMESIIGVARR